MIELTNSLAVTASANVKARARQTYVKRLSASQYLVTPRSYAKSRRLVTFSLRAGKVFAVCDDYRTGEQCPANEFDSLCYHCLAAFRRAQINARREFSNGD